MSFLEGLLWLTLNVYHEARGETLDGQLAVAHVTLNRAVKKNMSVEDIVTAPYQFSWTFQKKSYMPTDSEAFLNCMKVSLKAMISSDFTDGSTFYHHQNILPYWADDMKYIAQYGTHKFYRNM